MLEIFQYGFIVRALEAGIIISLIAPLIGIFLVLRRYSLIADTLSHVSLAGVAAGLLFKINPIITAIGVTVLSSIIIERLRLSKKVYGESALSLFLSGSLAIAIILISVAKGFTTSLFSYLFGSILTVTQFDIYVIASVGLFVMVVIAGIYKELLFISFDEEAAMASGIKVKILNTVLIVLASLTVALSIPIVGVLLISALIVIPVINALQLRKGFLQTLFIAEFFSVSSVVLGILSSFYLDIPTGATIVLILIVIFIFIQLWKK